MMSNATTADDARRISERHENKYVTRFARLIEEAADEGAPAVCTGRHMAVRSITPLECERLQGFPDNHTRIPYRGKPAEECPDGPRYKAIGNSMAVPVMRWIGERIAMADKEEAR